MVEQVDSSEPSTSEHLWRILLCLSLLRTRELNVTDSIELCWLKSGVENQLTTLLVLLVIAQSPQKFSAEVHCEVGCESICT